MSNRTTHSTISLKRRLIRANYRVDAGPARIGAKARAEPLAWLADAMLSPHICSRIIITPRSLRWLRLEFRQMFEWCRAVTQSHLNSTSKAWLNQTEILRRLTTLRITRHRLAQGNRLSPFLQLWTRAEVITVMCPPLLPIVETPWSSSKTTKLKV